MRTADAGAGGHGGVFPANSYHPMSTIQNQRAQSKNELVITAGRLTAEHNNSRTTCDFLKFKFLWLIYCPLSTVRSVLLPDVNALAENLSEIRHQ